MLERKGRKSNQKAKYKKERKEYLTGNGYSQADIDRLRVQYVDIVKTLNETNEKVQKQTIKRYKRRKI